MLDGREYVVPPVTIGALMQVQERLEAMTANLMSPENLDTVMTIAHAALKRNYPELTREQLLDMLDVGNVKDVFDAVVDAGGLRRKALEDAGKMGPRDP